MAANPTVLTTNRGGNSSSFNTASISPSANNIVFVCVANNDTSGGPDTPSVSGAGMSWTQVATRVYTGTGRRVTIFRGVSASPGSGALTISFGSTQDQCLWTVIEWDGLITTGTNGADAVVQSAGGEVAGTSFTINLSAFDDPNNAAFGFIYINDTFGVSVTPGSGFTELVELNNVHTIQAQWKDTSDTTVDWSNGESKNWVGLALELAVKPSSGGGSFLYNML